MNTDNQSQKYTSCQHNHFSGINFYAVQCKTQPDKHVFIIFTDGKFINLILSAMAIFGLSNRFNEFRNDFLKDTGAKNVEDNMELYALYVTARFADHNNRILNNLANEIQELHKVLKKV